MGRPLHAAIRPVGRRPALEGKLTGIFIPPSICSIFAIPSSCGSSNIFDACRMLGIPVKFTVLDLNGFTAPYLQRRSLAPANQEKLRQFFPVEHTFSPGDSPGNSDRDG
ncbi:hypothetical protein D3C77_404180 [compost metagenome]